MKKIAWPVMIYALALIVLGYIGHQEAGSKISLYAGVGSGAVLLMCAFLMFGGQKIGAYLSLVMTGALTAIFAVRYSNTGKEFPALFAVISAGMLIYLLVKVIPRKR